MIKNPFLYEKRLFQKGYKNIVGVDEVGRGSLAGPVVAGAFLLVQESVEYLSRSVVDQIDDSKMLLPKKREKIYAELLAHTSFSVGVVSSFELDAIGLTKAVQKAMDKAIQKLGVEADYIITDGGHFYFSKPFSTVIDGDATIFSVAAASIVAKVMRDEMMVRISKKFPLYELEKNKGYGTQKHRDAIKKYGPTRQHRFTFSPLKDVVY